MKRRAFLKRAAALPPLAVAPNLLGKAKSRAEGESASAAHQQGTYRPRRIPNEYVIFLPGEREILETPPSVSQIASGGVNAQHGTLNRTVVPGQDIGGWQLVAVLPALSGAATAVFEKHVAHRGIIVYVTRGGEVARIPKYVGDLSKIRPRPVKNAPGIKFERPARYLPGPDVCGNYILNSVEDPCYENVAALGEEYTGWTLVANGETGPAGSLWLEPDGRSRQFGDNPESLWAPDKTGRLFDPRDFLPSEYLYDYVPGYSKRTLLGGYLPVADIGVWNPRFKVGYEVMMVLPSGADARPIGRIRAMLPMGSRDGLIPSGDSNRGQPPQGATFVERYWNGSAEDFFTALAEVWNRWQNFFNKGMRVEIPDEWLLNAARAGIVLSRTSYNRLRPTYQIGEGAYTKIPEHSHALFPVAHYEFVWAHQIWNLTSEVQPYFDYYLDHYILPDGNFLYNTQDQVEAPLNAGVFLENSARAYDYTRDINALRKRLPVLRRMIGWLLERYRYSKAHFPASDPRHGLIWGSPEADKGDPHKDFPESHPYYFQNASWTWRGLQEQARCLNRAGTEHNDEGLRREAAGLVRWATEIRSDAERSLAMTMAARDPAMKKAGITPFEPFDTHRQPAELSSYENHRYMMDWWTSDWGDAELDLGHFRHRRMAGEQVLGMNTDGAYPRTSNFMEHGTLAGRIRQEDYRPFLLALYGNVCYAMDSGNRYSPEDALLPGSFAGEGNRYAWSAVVNSELQPALGLRWLLCYEEHDRAVVHLLKAAPRHWFDSGEKIRMENCPTRFGAIGCTMEAKDGSRGLLMWQFDLHFPAGVFAADLILHVHPPDGRSLQSTTAGELRARSVLLPAALLAKQTKLAIEVT
jgi:hypothetical protein